MKRFFFSTYFFTLFAIVLTSVVINWLSSIYIKRTYQDTINTSNHDLSRGCFYLLEKELIAWPESEYQAVLDALQPQFGYPLKLVQKEDVTLSLKEQQDAEKGRIIVRDEGELHLTPIGDSDYFVTMGPFPNIDFKPLEGVLFFTSGALLFGVLILPWAFFFWNKLIKFRRAARQFGQGNFSARVEMSRFSSLAAIATTFNSMADQIERLISSHKQLVNAVSHELRTPISRIRFGIEEVRQIKGKEGGKQLEGIRRDVDELDDLVSELLSYIRFERVEDRIDLPENPLVPWLEEYIRLARETFDTAIDYAWDEIDKRAVVKFDPRLLERALHNILQNGDRFAASLLTVRLTSEDNMAILTIADDGPGISEKDHKRIFEPFIRLESSRNKESGGYGLGLSIVREILRSHKGEISVGASTSGGAKFILRLPIAPQKIIDTKS